LTLVGGNAFGPDAAEEANAMVRLKKISIKMSHVLKTVVERLRGLDFTSQIQPQAGGYDPAVVFKSSPSGGGFLRRVLDDLEITAADAIIDIGCGKGSAMRTMAEYPFYKVDGVELSERIADIARRNFSKLGCDKCTVFTMNAADFTAYDHYGFVYFYNPFPAAVMSKVIDNLLDSLTRAQRKLVVIYDNPLCHEETIKGGVLHKTAEYPDEWGNKIFLYSNK
jgi:SAM-dependent methyltransferase